MCVTRNLHLDKGLGDLDKSSSGGVEGGLQHLMIATPTNMHTTRAEVVSALWRAAREAACCSVAPCDALTTSRYFDLGTATLFDAGLTDVESVEHFLAMVHSAFGLEAGALTLEAALLQPTLDSIAVIVLEAVHEGVVARSKSGGVTATRTSKPVVERRVSSHLGLRNLRVAMLLLPFIAMPTRGTGFSCVSEGPSYASLFTYEDFGAYERVNSTQCGESYILYPRGQSAPDLGPSYKYFGVPLQDVALTQTVPVAFIETLGARDAISVASPYTTSACLAQRVGNGDAETFVSASSALEQHKGQMNRSALEAVLSDPYGASNWADPSTAPKLICAAETYETTPLGGAEWLKFYGYFFGAKASATAAFCGTGARYSCNTLAASSISNSAATLGASSYSYKVPTVLFASLSWNGDFSIQMTPYKNRLVNDAGAVYPDLNAFDAFKTTHWTGAYVSGFQFPAANASAFHAALATADVILDETYPNGQTLAAIMTSYGLDSVPAADRPPAIAAKRVYTLDGTMDSRGPPYGGTDFYESRVAEPDGFLADVIKVAHPSGTDYSPAGLRYLRHAEAGTIATVTATDCTNVNAPRPIHASSCEALAQVSDAVLGWLVAFNSYKSPPPLPPAAPAPSPAGASPPAGLLAGIIVLGVITLGLTAGLAVVYTKLAAKLAATAPSNSKA